MLHIMFEDFTEEDMDEWYDPEMADLSSALQVAEFVARFRRESRAIDDARCGDLRPGDRLCLACDMDGGGLKYYDAVFKSVRPPPCLLMHTVCFSN